jgi:glucosamine-6-phosphate deaminase
MIKTSNRFKADRLKVRIYESRLLMGEGAALNLTEEIKELMTKQAFVNIIFAAAPSQNEFLAALIRQKGIDWNRTNAFHMDEYIGLDKSHPGLFGNFLKDRLFDKVPFNKVHYLNGNAEDPNAECRRYSDLLNEYPADIVCMGIGENAHLAFNDPHVADFKDPLLVKTVDLDKVSRRQQVNDGCFAAIDEVPVSAITLTVPALLRANAVYCIVPGINKAKAVYHTLYAEVSEQYPSTSLRKHPHATLYLDKESAVKINKDHSTLNF